MGMLEEARRYVDLSPTLREALGCAAKDPLEVEPLGQGEHNANFLLKRADAGRVLCVLRVNCTSQLGLENQVLYEARALESLRSCGRAPRLYLADDSRETIDRGVLAIEYCPGRRLDFARDDDLRQVAACLAQVHAVNPFGSAGRCEAPLFAREGLAMPGLQQSESVLRTLLEEDCRMCARYRRWAKAEQRVVDWLDRLEAACTGFAAGFALRPLRPSIVNTECIAAHFLIDEEGSAHMVDWEKAIVGDAAQDVAYFLAPTTTIWDDDFIFSQAQRERFLREYLACTGMGESEGEAFAVHCAAFMPLICLRGISYCAAAKIDYDNPDTLLKNEKTERKLDEYLSEEFLQLVFDEHYRSRLA